MLTMICSPVDKTILYFQDGLACTLFQTVKKLNHLITVLLTKDFERLV
jgi:hypothetical protein